MATEQQILNHQLQGIMLHSDMMDMYHLFRMKKFCRVHKRQLFHEMKAHNETKFAIIDEKGEIIEPGSTTRLKITDANLTDAVFSKLRKDSIHEQALMVWHKWELDTVAMYKEMAVENPDCKLWKRLCCEVECEIKMIEKWMQQ